MEKKKRGLSLLAALMALCTMLTSPVWGAESTEEGATEDAAYYAAYFAMTEANLTAGSDQAETNLGDLVADAMRWKAEKAGEKADAALIAAASLDSAAAIPAGDVARGTIRDLLPGEDTLCVIRVTGEQLLEALEAATRESPAASETFPQVSGLTFTVNGLVSYLEGESYSDTAYFAPAQPGRRITVSTVGEREFRSAATYTIATTGSIAAGGTAYGAFAGAVVVYDEGETLESVVMEYIAEALSGVISAAQYGSAQERIRVIGYQDVSADSWYAPGVNFVTTRNLMQGSGGYFYPDREMSRAMVASALYRMAGSPAVVGHSPFLDVAEDAWYADAVMWAAERGLINGTGDGYFQPDGSITREQLAAILFRYAEMAIPTGSLDRYTDSDSVSAYAREAMRWAVGAGLIGGATETTLNPQGTATRAQTATILMRYAMS